MAFSFFSLLIFSFSFFHQPLPSIANLHKTSLFRSLISHDPTSINANASSPTTYFQVTKPIKLPNTKPCSQLILHHNFAYTYGEPPVLAHYNPPSNCPSNNFAKIVLEWSATCKGLQFDRIFGVWLGGVELLRSCTAEPRATGIYWTVKKDVTRYYSLLMTNQTLAVYLGNIVDTTYTGVYHVNVTFHFYPHESDNSLGHENVGGSADLILPISRNLPLNDGLWFEIENSSDVESKEFEIPQNAYKAVLEVYVSFHENDEFWYTNLPNEYIDANDLDGTPGNGPFREVLVNLDGDLVGAIWPFTVIFTGGVNPLLWRPITGIGSFDLPSYDIEITPLLEKLLDGKTHNFSFSVTNALNVWYVDANLHLWLDKESAKTEGKLLTVSSNTHTSEVSNFKGLSGTFLKNAQRTVSSIGWVKSSHGKITTTSNQELGYSNIMVLGNDGNMQIVNQTIDMNNSVKTKTPNSSIDHSIESFKRFPLYLYSDYVDQADGAYISVANLTLGFIEKNVKTSGFGTSFSSLNNLQNGQGSMRVKGNLVVSGLGSTQELYHFDDGEYCYFRNVSSSNYEVLYDKTSYTCDSSIRLSNEGNSYAQEGLSVI